MGRCMPSPASSTSWCVLPSSTCAQGAWGLLAGDGLAQTCWQGASIDAGEVADAAEGAADAEIVVDAPVPDADLTVDAAAAVDAAGPLLQLGAPTVDFPATAAGTSAEKMVTITNIGGSPSGPVTISVDPGVFSATAPCAGQSLQPGVPCTVTVTFHPATATSYQATLTVSAIPGGMTSAGLSGGGSGTAALMVAPPQANFGTVVVGSPATVGLVLNNTGLVDTGALAAAITGPQGSEFTLQDDMCSGMTLKPGGMCTLIVRLVAAAAGSRMATLTFSWPSGPSIPVTLSASAAAPGALAISPTEKTFTPIAVGSTTSAPFTITNMGGSDTGALTVEVTGGDAAQFDLIQDGCSTKVLSASGTCMVTVVFSPDAVGAKSASLRITASPGGTATASLSAAASATLGVNKLGNGSGTVKSTSPSGIDCGATCSATFSSSPVTLSATPSANSDFAGWSAPGCSGTGDCSMTLDAAQTSVDATFTLKKYELSVIRNGNGGTVTSPAGINCGSTCTISVDADTVVSLTANPAAGWDFTSWGNACSGTGACMVTMSGPKTVEANFTLKPVALTVTVGGMGSVADGDGFISCPTSCTHTYTAGSMTTLTATPVSGYFFSRWTGDCAGSDTCLLPMDVDRNVTAEFKRKPVTNGEAATVLIGQPDFMSSALPGAQSPQVLAYPSGLATNGTWLWVHDSCYARVLQFSLPVGTPASASLAIGQYSMYQASGGAPTDHVMAATCGDPCGIGFGANKLWVADTPDSRVLRFDGIPTQNGPVAARVLGQTLFTTKATGLTSSTLSAYGPTGVWSDGTKVIVADRNNHRVLIWNSVTSDGQAANVVLGQPNFTSKVGTYPPNSQSIYDPVALHVDGTRLFVADQEYHRILVWNTIPTTSNKAADVVIGQPDFASWDINASRGAVTNPYGFDMPYGMTTFNNSLFVSDFENGRVMVYSPIPTASDLPAATGVLGGANLTTNYRDSTPSATTLGRPYGLAVAGNVLYVADEEWHRVVGFALTQ